MATAQIERSQRHSGNRPFVKEQYENLWDNTYGKAMALLDRGETNLARIHMYMRRGTGDGYADAKLNEKYRKKEEDRRKFGFLYDGQLLACHEVDSIVSSRMLDLPKMNEVVQACGDGIQRVIETGAGWGKTLLNIYLHGGPPAAEYWALELTEAGIKTAQLIAGQVAGDVKLRAQQFDYHEPEFTCLRDETPTLLVTHHSIEQIPQLSEAYLDRALAIPGFRRGLHLEPVGWQIRSDSWLRKPHSIWRMRQIDRMNRNYALKRNLNQNLYALLREYERRGRIRITTVRKHYCSTIPYNATTLIVWEKADACPAPSGNTPPRRDDLNTSCGLGAYFRW